MIILSKLISSELIFGGAGVKEIEKRRKAMRMTQAELATQLGVTQGAISQWESGATMPDVKYLLDMSEIFHCTVDEILKGNSARR